MADVPASRSSNEIRIARAAEHPPCICRCPAADHKWDKPLIPCEACRCFAYRPTETIAAWYTREAATGGIENPAPSQTCRICWFTIPAGEYRYLPEGAKQGFCVLCAVPSKKELTA